MTRIEAGELRPQLHPVLLDDAVADTVDRLRSSFGGRVVQVEVPQDLPPVLVDEVYLDAILSNLLDNAIKYSPDDGPVRVSACRPPEQGDAAAAPAESSGDRVRLVVEDAGPGVSDDALTRIFEKFYRAPSTGGGSRRGSGIGLAIVRGLTEAMGGTVVATRSSLGGLAVSVELPATSPVAPQP